jgi:hypothetical protein
MQCTMSYPSIAASRAGLLHRLAFGSSRQASGSGNGNVNTQHSCSCLTLRATKLHSCLPCRLALGCVSKQLNAIIREPSSLWQNLYLHFDYAEDILSWKPPMHTVQRVAFVRRHLDVLRSVHIGPNLVSDKCLLSLNTVTVVDVDSWSSAHAICKNLASKG